MQAFLFVARRATTAYFYARKPRRKKSRFFFDIHLHFLIAVTRIG